MFVYASRASRATFPITRAKLLAHHGVALIPPQSREYPLSAEFKDWHRKQVFKEPGRE